jgi:sterol 14-demethylase
MYFASVWCGAMALLFIAIVLSTKFSRARNAGHLPPLVNGIALLALVPTLLKKGLPAVFSDLYAKYGSVFMLSFFGLDVTLLIGPEVSAHFFQALESEISNGKLFEFTVPLFGKEVCYGRDSATRIEQMRFNTEELKASKLRNHVSAMLQEVEVIICIYWLGKCHFLLITGT